MSWFSSGLLVSTFIVLMEIGGVVAAFHAIQNARTSQGAIAWAISLIALPYLTLIPYLFLGSKRFFGYVDARRLRDLQMRSRSQPAAWKTRIAQLNDHDKLAENLGQRATHALEKLAGARFMPANRVRLLIDGEATFAAIFAAIEQATHYVMVQYFVVHDDQLGRQLQQILLTKAAQGVQVYFLYDGIGCSKLPRHYVETLRAGGIVIHKFATRRFINRFQVNFRNHRKIVVVDGRRAFIGGLNAGDEYLGKKPLLSPWRDTHIEIEGLVVADIQETFTQDWFWATQALPLSAPPTPQVDTNMHCLAIASGPADQYETCSLFFVEAINTAHRRVWIATPYFVPDEAVFSALRLAVMRGVDVRILIPQQSDHFGVYYASMLYAHDAVQAGIKIFRYKPGFCHQKVLLIDDKAAAIGSANLDNRSFRLNFEIMLLTVDDAFAIEVAAMLEQDFAQAYAVPLTEVDHAPSWRRIIMHVARLFSPLL